MLKMIGGLAFALVISSSPTLAAKGKPARSYEECHKLAVERGMPRHAPPQRYVERGSEGRDARGFMAQCMSGKLR